MSEVGEVDTLALQDTKSKPHVMEQISNAEPSNESKITYLNYLHQIIDQIKEQAKGYGGWWVIGGLARDAIMGNAVSYIGPDGSFKDLDVIFSEPMQNGGSKIQNQNHTPLRVGTSLQNVVKIVPGQKARLEFG